MLAFLDLTWRKVQFSILMILKSVVHDHDLVFQVNDHTGYLFLSRENTHVRIFLMARDKGTLSLLLELVNLVQTTIVERKVIFPG